MSVKVLDALRAAHAAAIESTETLHGDDIAWIKRDNLLQVATWLQTDPAMAFDAPVFCTCIDRLDWKPIDVPPGPPVYPASQAWSEDKPRFEVCYQLRSTKHRH
ncbi:MAG TPA: NADH-quinone oxidoreductase subunit C, partial [Kofleriaceae bacterium]|nr:NADH-quinone oxidoreductase subunit C [Kofleriaceae bacterium]